MKVRMVVTVDVDAKAWAAEYGTEPTRDEVARDVRSYFETAIFGVDAVETVGLAVRVA